MRPAARWIAAAGALLLGCGGALLARQGWLLAKAEMAAVLIDRAWEAHLRDGGEHHPWPWADIVPVARLRAPRLGIDRAVLSGATGSTLAFGLGHLDGTAPPGRPGACALAGHRDTWGAFLGDLVAGDTLVVITRGGAREYRVERLEVVDQGQVEVLDQDTAGRLILITCYPFGALRGGPLRFVVTCSLAGPPRAGPQVPDRRGTSRR